MEAQVQEKPFDKYSDAVAMQAQCAKFGPTIMEMSVVELGGDFCAPGFRRLVKKVEQGHRCQDDAAVAWLHFSRREDISRFCAMVDAFDAPKADAVPCRLTGGERETLDFLRSGKIIFHHSSPKVA